MSAGTAKTKQGAVNYLQFCVSLIKDVEDLTKNIKASDTYEL